MPLRSLRGVFTEADAIKRLLVSAADWMDMNPIAIPVSLPVDFVPDRCAILNFMS